MNWVTRMIEQHGGPFRYFTLYFSNVDGTHYTTKHDSLANLLQAIKVEDHEGAVWSVDEAVDVTEEIERLYRR